MALNLRNLKKADEQLKNRGGSNLYLKQGDIGDETFFRILPPKPEMNGVYYFERTIYWINKRPVVCPSTFGLPSVIEERIEAMKEEASATSDEELTKLVEDLNPQTQFLVPGLHLKYKYDANEEWTGFEVEAKKPKILQCTIMLLRAINAVALTPKMARRYKNVPDGITDRVEGCNLVLSKSVENKRTKYTAFEDEVMEMDAKYFENSPSVISLSKKECYTDDYLNALLDQYFDGAAKPEDSLKKSRFADELAEEKAEEPKEEKKPTRRRRKASTPKTEEVQETTEEIKETEVNDVEEVAPEPKEKKPARRTRRRRKAEEPAKEEPKADTEEDGSILDQLEDLDD